MKKPKALLSFATKVSDSVFAKPKSLAVLDGVLQKTNDYIMPEDMHIKSSDFIELFTKPGFVLKFTKVVQSSSSSSTMQNQQHQQQRDGEDAEEVFPDAVFWASNDASPMNGMIRTTN